MFYTRSLFCPLHTGRDHVVGDTMGDEHANELCYCINSLVSKHRKGQCLNTKIASGFATTFGLEPPPKELQELWKPIAPRTSPSQPRITFPATDNTQKQCRCTEAVKFPHRGGKCFYTLNKKKMAAVAAQVPKRKPSATPGGVVDLSPPTTVLTPTTPSEQSAPSITADASDTSSGTLPFDFNTHIFPLLPSISIPFTFPLLLGQVTAPPAPPPPPAATESPSTENSGQATGVLILDSGPLDASVVHLEEPTHNHVEEPMAAPGAPGGPSESHKENADPGDGIVADPGELTAAADGVEARVPIPMKQVGAIEVPPPAPVLAPAAALHPAPDAALIPQETAMPPLAALPTVMPAPAPEHGPDLAPMPPAVHHIVPPIDTPAEVQVVPNQPLQDDAPPNNDLEDLMAGLMGEWQVPGEELQESDEEDAENYDDTVTVSGRDVLPEMQRRLQRYEDADDASVFTVRAL